MTKAHPVENDVKAALSKILDRHNVFWWSNPANRFSRSGVSDRSAIWRGTFLAIEVKLNVKKNPPTNMQKAFLVSVQSSGGLAFVVDQERLDAFDEYMTLWEKSADLAQQQKPEDPEIMVRLIDLYGLLSWEVV